MNKEDGGIKDVSPVIKEKEKKKSKWWIALIVIGILLNILIIFLVKKYEEKVKIMNIMKKEKQ